MTMKTIQNEKEINTDKPTRHYDAIATNVRKLLSASCQTFIPQLCDALRQDWAPELSDEQIRRQLKFQKLIRSKIVSEWSKEGGHSEDNIWSDKTIPIWFPNWLRNPLQEEVGAKNLVRANEALAKKIAISKMQKTALVKFATSLPKTVIIPEPKQPQEKYTPLDDEELDKELHSMQMGKFGETGQSLRELYGDITHHSDGLFKVLTQKDMPYADNVDLIVDFIKPTREYWKSLMLEFDETKRTRLHNELSFLTELIEDRLEILSHVME